MTAFNCDLHPKSKVGKGTKNGGLVGFRLFQFGQVLCGIFIEVVDAGFAAEFDGCAFVLDDVRIAMRAEFFTRHNAGGERVGVSGFAFFLWF